MKNQKRIYQLLTIILGVIFISSFLYIAYQGYLYFLQNKEQEALVQMALTPKIQEASGFEAKQAAGEEKNKTQESNNSLEIKAENRWSDGKLDLSDYEGYDALHQNPKVPINFQTLYEQNPDVAGWITIPGTRINYPIVAAEDNEFYLKHGFQKQKSSAGAIFLDMAADKDFAGRNTVIYGHHMKNGTMFKDIMKYRKEDYLRQNPDLWLYTPKRVIHLKAIACYYLDSDPFVRRTSFSSKEDFDDWMNELLKPCSKDLIPDPLPEQVVIFVTCSYERSSARTILITTPVIE